MLQHLARRFPDADLFTLFHRPGRVPREIERLRITTSALDRLPGARKHYRKLLPLFPWAVGRFDLRGYDLVLSTSHAVAKSVRVPPDVPHLDYCFTPMRYVWDQADAYLGRGLRRAAARPAIDALRRFDVARSGPETVTRFVAASQEVAGRIRRHYGREANVVAPPVDTSWIRCASGPPEDFYLLVGGFVPYKRDALAVEAFGRLRRRLVVVGDGPGRAALERRAPPQVEFLGRVPDTALASLYRRCRALIQPQCEDFGLTAVEAQAAGRPVIAFGRGGALDTVKPLPADDLDGARGARRATGVFFHEPTPDALATAVERFEKNESAFDPQRIRSWAESFAPARFDRALDREIAATLEAAR